ncbi:hypothetical protein LMG19083_01532 [Ralstonia psammae]|uniref:Uncharacterized protein n=1 Tax=Ralstonia psammae TaxID=3058598 RepID=A0ABM9J9Y5_9RALS|nr:hypothetical protein [Ralstonia sp. LMG 19083]CAJ0787122.1 hypothetical protein LMG19083_01532 [Ralstonia sp. LMG 19083]
MRHPEQQASAPYSPLSAVPPTPQATRETARLVAETIPFHIERGGQSIEATYSTRNGIVTVKYRGKTLSTYSPQGDKADYKAVARQLLSVMLTI